MNGDKLFCFPHVMYQDIINEVVLLDESEATPKNFIPTKKQVKFFNLVLISIFVF